MQNDSIESLHSDRQPLAQVCRPSLLLQLRGDPFIVVLLLLIIRKIVRIVHIATSLGMQFIAREYSDLCVVITC